MGKLRNLAIAAAGGGYYTQLETVVATHKDGVTVNGIYMRHPIDKNSGEIKNQRVFTYEEEPGKCFPCEGAVLTGFIDNFVKDCGGTLESTNAALKDSPQKMTFEKRKCAKGYYWIPIVLDD